MKSYYTIKWCAIAIQWESNVSKKTHTHTMEIQPPPPPPKKKMSFLLPTFVSWPTTLLYSNDSLLLLLLFLFPIIPFDKHDSWLLILLLLFNLTELIRGAVKDVTKTGVDVIATNVVTKTMMFRIIPISKLLPYGTMSFFSLLLCRENKEIILILLYCLAFFEGMCNYRKKFYEIIWQSHHLTFRIWERTNIRTYRENKKKENWEYNIKSVRTYVSRFFDCTSILRLPYVILFFSHFYS